jgi:ferrochelatase
VPPSLFPGAAPSAGAPSVPRRPGVLLMAYGGPDRLDQVEAYYTDIRHGSPPPPALLEELVGRYRAIGGGSPLAAIVERQRAALELELARRGLRVPVRAGMRHVDPRIGDVLRDMASAGIDHVVCIALAPQRSPGVVGYRDAVGGAIRSLGSGAPSMRVVESWHDEPAFIRALVRVTADAIATVGATGAVGALATPAVVVVFTAHSLPERLGDEAVAYRAEVEHTAALVSRALGLAGHTVALQSAGRTGERWLGPDLRDEIRRLAREGAAAIVVCPVGFVADHLEVLYDIDIDARAVAREAGVELVRARSMNDDATFIGGLADIVIRALTQPGEHPAMPGGVLP